MNDEKSWVRLYWFRVLCVVLVVGGLMAVFLSSHQAYYEGTITAVGETVYKKGHSTGHGRSDPRYITALTVSYADQEGETRQAEVKVTHRSWYNSPRVGQGIKIVEEPWGMEAYPSQSLKQYGAMTAIFAATALITALLTSNREKKERDGIPNLDRPEQAEEAPLSPLGPYPKRVTQMSNGAYRWTCALSREYERKTYRISMIACSVIAAFILVMGACICAMQRQWDSLWVFFLCDAVFMLIAFLICWGLNRLPGSVHQVYELTEEHIRLGTGKNTQFFSFHRTKQVTVRDNYIDLKGAMYHPRVFVPPEDFPFVRDFILERVPDSAEKDIQ